MTTAFRSAALPCLLAASSLLTSAADYAQWRGPRRDGLSAETGLAKEWPAEGPRLVWTATGIGSGYAAPAVEGDRIYVLASDGPDNEFVEALGVQDGKRQWAAKLGAVGNPSQQPNFPTARSTPTVDGPVLYALSSDGVIACVETSGGALRWQRSLRTDFGGKPGVWAYAESPLVDGDAVIVAPGGATATVVALDKKTGATLWKTALPEGDEAAYASALAVEVNGVRQYVELLQKGLVGLDAKTGKFLWRYGKPVSRYGANIPTPVASGDLIFAGAAGTGAGAMKLKAKDGGFEAESVYFEAKLPTAIGGSVKVGDYLYGTGTALECVDFATGKILWQERSVGSASLCFADGRLYLHGENGEVALVEPSPDGYREKGRFTPPGQPKAANDMEKTWAYPVVANGRLYIRAHGSLWSYDIKAATATN